MTNQTLNIGDLVINFGALARVVAVHDSTAGYTAGVRNGAGDPILQAVRRSGKGYGGRWIADAGRCKVITAAAAESMYEAMATAQRS